MTRLVSKAQFDFLPDGAVLLAKGDSTVYTYHKESETIHWNDGGMDIESALSDFELYYVTGQDPEINKYRQ